jgi:RND family efflux transporter MFP subunit
LNHQRAIEPKVVDEAQDYFESSLEAEAAAKEAIAQAQERATAAEADIALAVANVKESEAAVSVAAAELEKSRVMLSYTEIRSPYNGVITRRSFHPGDFIRAADLGGVQQPILSVERTDKMRVVVHVPDRDVPYVGVGDEAELQVDALPGLVLKAVVARKAESEDTDTRTMRTEVDVENTQGLLYRGMYGQATLRLDSGPAGALRIPSAALLGKVDEHHAQVRVGENGKLRTIALQIGADNGMQTEVLSGLQANQLVVVRGSSAIADGAFVSVTVRPNQL